MNYYFINSDADTRDDINTCDILISKGIACSGGDFEKYGIPLKSIEPKDICLLYHDGQGLVAVGRALETWDQISHVTKKIIYTNSDLPEYRLRVDWFIDLRATPINTLTIFGYTPRGVVQRVVKKLEQIKNFIETHNQSPPNLSPDETSRESSYTEGEQSNSIAITRNRNKAARTQCIAHYGSACKVCGFDFSKKYGPIGEEYIHVHHLNPISDTDGVRVVDPINDLRPVCANCHAMIHKKNPPYKLEEIRLFIRKGDMG